MEIRSCKDTQVHYDREEPEIYNLAMYTETVSIDFCLHILLRDLGWKIADVPPKSIFLLT